MAVITISREFGSGGDEIAARICEMLGYRSFDKRLMAQVASDMGLLEHQVVDLSEDNYEVRKFWDRLFGRDNPRVVTTVGTWKRDATGSRVPDTEVLDEANCIAMVKETIRTAHKQGNIVIVGRGGQAILRDKPDVLHVRIIASYQERVQRVQRHEKVTVQQARILIEDRDQAAADYLDRFYDIDWADPMLYHQVINAGKWSVEAAAHLIVHAVSYMPAVETEEAEKAGRAIQRAA